MLSETSDHSLGLGPAGKTALAPRPEAEAEADAEAEAEAVEEEREEAADAMTTERSRCSF